MDWWWDLLSAMDAHEGQAAWAQFVGAMVAVGLALGQGYSAARRDKARDRAAATAAYTLVENATQVAGQMYSELVVTHRAARRGVAERMVNDRRLDMIEAAIIAFDTTKLPADVFVTGVSQAQTALRSFRQALGAIVHPPQVLMSPDLLDRAIQQLQRSAGIMVPALVMLSEGARGRAFRTKVLSAFGRVVGCVKRS